ncbi:hypothetical protein [Halorussus sp. AFM4]|uniref:hypothetical protein n=1 Tax=Halorussus sp. AFM4 TaxID=3421651 RepID=UPI003EB9F259
MRRRRFLALAGSTASATATAAATAGCLSALPGAGPPIDVGCPSFSADAESVCAHTASSPPVVLRPSSWTLSAGSGVALEVTFSNESDRDAHTGQFPSLKRREDGEWTHVWPMVKSGSGPTVAPGGSYSWEFRFEKERPAHESDENVDLYALDPGTCALVLGAGVGDRSYHCVAPFEVGGE